MKVLHVIDTLGIGGAERVMVDLSNILQENGEEVAALFLLEKGPLAKELNHHIQQYELKRYKRFSIKSIFRFISIVKQYDIVHVHMRHCFEYVSFASLFYPPLRRKVVFHDHYGDINIDDKCPFVLKTALNHCLTAYIGVSDQLVDWAKRNGTTNCYLMPNIVRKQKVEVDKKQTLTDYISVGTIRKTKNYEYLIKLASQMPEKRFTIYGNTQIPEYMQSIKGILCKNVTIVEGVSNVQPLLQQYRIAIHCAPSETGPLVLIEFLAQGIPFLAYRTGEVVRQIQDDLPELIVDDFETETWIKRLKHIEDNYDSIKNKLSVVYDKYYSEQNYYNTCNQIYRRVQNC